jgi:hypothetical protein
VGEGLGDGVAVTVGLGLGVGDGVGVGVGDGLGETVGEGPGFGRLDGGFVAWASAANARVAQTARRRVEELNLILFSPVEITRLTGSLTQGSASILPTPDYRFRRGRTCRNFGPL